MSLCNICGSWVEKGAGTDICPGCQLRPRHRAVFAFLSAHGDPTRQGKTLICNATPDERRFLFANVASLTNFDIRPMSYLDLVMDVQDMKPVEFQSFDTFVALHVLNHVEDDDRAIAEIARVLRPNGRAIITVPMRRNATTERCPDVTQHYGTEALSKFGVGTYRYYGRDDFIHKLSNYFDVSEYSFADPITTHEEIVLNCIRIQGTRHMSATEVLPSSEEMARAERQKEQARIYGPDLELRHTAECRVLPNRNFLLDVLPKGGVAAELGVAFGDFSMEILNRTQPKELHLVDLWGTERYSAGFSRVTERFADYIERKQVVIKRGFSTEIIETYPDQFFDFVYIDTSHAYDLTLAELQAAAPKVKRGGILAGHDFCVGNIVPPIIYGVIQACNKFCRDAGWRYRYLTLETGTSFSFGLEKM